MGKLMIKLDLTQKQKKLVGSVMSSNITIWSDEMGTGKSYISYLLPFMLRANVIVISPFRVDSGREFSKLIDVVGEVFNGITYTRDTLSTKEGGASLTFSTDVYKLRMVGRDNIIVIDHPELFSESEINFISSFYGRNRLVFLTHPDQCGWRTPKYALGKLQYNKKGTDILCAEVSWDSNLILWEKGGTLATNSDYKEGVNVIN